MPGHARLRIRGDLGAKGSTSSQYRADFRVSSGSPILRPAAPPNGQRSHPSPVSEKQGYIIEILESGLGVPIMGNRAPLYLALVNEKSETDADHSPHENEVQESLQGPRIGLFVGRQPTSVRHL